MLCKIAVFTAAKMKNVTLHRSCDDRRFGGTANCSLLLTAYVVPSSLILSTLMMTANVPPKHYLLHHSDCTTSQKTAFFINQITSRMPSSGMLRRVALVIIDVTEGRSASIIMVTRRGEVGTTLALTSNRRKSRINITK
jgi:hypothetical protein